MKKLAALLAALTLSAPAAAPAAVLNDEVTSVKLKEADGTSGQNTNSGAGVKTGHLQNAAVTAAKIAPGAVGASQLAPAAVGTAAIADGAITAAKLAPGAVTDASISGTISTTKLSVGTGAGTVAAGNHDHDAVYRKKVTNVRIVSKDGKGDFTDPAAALASIPDASATNPYLVKIMPGDYLLAAPLIAMAHVAIEGSGEDVTTLTYAPAVAQNTAGFQIPGNASMRSLTLHVDTEMIGVAITGTGPVSLRDVTIQNAATKGALGDLMGISTIGTNTLSLDHVRVRVDAFPGSWTSVRGLDLRGPTTMNHVEVTVNGGSHAHAMEILNGSYQVDVVDSSLLVTASYESIGIISGGWASANVLRIRNSVVYADSPGGGALALMLIGGQALVEHSELSGVTAGNPLGAAGTTELTTLSIAGSKLGGAVSSGGTTRCVGNYDANFAPAICN